MVDLSDALEAADALAILNRAIDRNDDLALAMWARTYGAAALEDCGREYETRADFDKELNEADDAWQKQVDDLTEQVAALDKECTDLTEENGRLADQIQELEAAALVDA